MKLLKRGPYRFRLYIRHNGAQEHLLIDLFSDNERYAVSWPGKAGSRKYIFILNVHGKGLAAIRKEILAKSTLSDYHCQADELARQINKARVIWKSQEGAVG